MCTRKTWDVLTHYGRKSSKQRHEQSVCPVKLNYVNSHQPTIDHYECVDGEYFETCGSQLHEPEPSAYERRLVQTILSISVCCGRHTCVHHHICMHVYWTRELTHNNQKCSTHLSSLRENYVMWCWMARLGTQRKDSERGSAILSRKFPKGTIGESTFFQKIQNDMLLLWLMTTSAKYLFCYVA